MVTFTKGQQKTVDAISDAHGRERKCRMLMSRQWKCEVECFSSLKMGTVILWAGGICASVFVITEDTIRLANSCGKVDTKVSLTV